ncbi:MAG: MFS transporter [Lachnospiraceae bacterium]|nr:MFS transporter [Lachnospiraceae bacterium]MDD7628721.1 MFS transporter [Lachnospiraceae bacterium]MDY4119055.1 MFS transporter [Lachnospiraceae bacterium]
MGNHKSNFSKFMLLWSGEFISAIGSGLTSFGLSVYVFRQTGSAASMGLVTLLAFLPTLLFSVPAGVLADKYDRRLLMMIGDGFSALGIVYILICMLQGEAKLYQICVGVFVSAVFSSLLEPSYRATVTDLLTKEEYSKASGLVSIAGSARYLISPVLAGILLAVSDIRLLFVIDISTFILTVISTAVVRKGIATKETENQSGFFQSLTEGWRAIADRRGVLLLILVSSVMTCFMGAIQILSEPLILDFADSTTLGIAQTVCASGMLVSGLFLGMRGIKKGYVKVLAISLFLTGITMIGFGIRENIYIICLFGFLFFATLPFANNCLDYLVRTNIPDELQGRAWGVIGFLSQIGYVVAYGLAGVAADGIASKLQIGVGRGAAGVVMTAGVLLSLTALFLYPIKSIRALERKSS